MKIILTYREQRYFNIFWLDKVGTQQAEKIERKQEKKRKNEQRERSYNKQKSEEDTNMST